MVFGWLARNRKKHLSKWRPPGRRVTVMARTRRRMTAREMEQLNRRTGGFRGMEVKYLDCAWNSLSINDSTDGSGGELHPSSGCISSLSVPEQGVGGQQRIGRKYVIRSVYLSGVVYYLGQAFAGYAQSYPAVYFALVLDTQPNGAALQSEDVFVNPSTLELAMLPQPLRNLQHSNRFRVLAHKTVRPQVYAFNDAAITASTNAQSEPQVSLSWKGRIVCECDGTAASVASAATNSIMLVAYSGGKVVGTPKFIGKSRMRFTD